MQEEPLYWHYSGVALLRLERRAEATEALRVAVARGSTRSGAQLEGKAHRVDPDFSS
jgi:hypothetical protein